MKNIFALAFLIMVASCAASKKQNNAQAPLLNVENKSNATVSRIDIVNGQNDTVTFSNIKAGKTSRYKAINNLCTCGYDMYITFSRGGDNTVTVNKSCVNIMPCTDYLTDKSTLEITGELSQSLPDVNADVSVNFKKAN